MQVLKKVPFEHNGKEYEVVVFGTENGFEVRALFNSQPVNGYRYSVDLDTCIDFSMVTGGKLLDHLIDMAIDDVRSGRWEAFLKLIQS